jgi:hypothetical protein
MVRRLLGDTRFRKNDHTEIIRLIASIFAKDASLRSYFNIRTGNKSILPETSYDLRISDPALRFIDHYGIIQEPLNADPDCIRNNLFLVEESFLNRFILGINALADPASAYSSIRTGLIVQRVENVHFNPYDVLPDPRWPRTRGFPNDRIDEAMAESITFSTYSVDGVNYTSPETYPYATFIIHDTSVLSTKAISVLVSGVLHGRFRIELPDLMYSTSIAPLPRMTIPPTEHFISSLLSDQPEAFSHIIFYDTEIYSHAMTINMSQAPTLSKYFWSMEDVTTKVMVRGLIKETSVVPNHFRRPDLSVCASGLVTPQGHITYDNHRRKDTYSISLSNPVLATTGRFLLANP